MKILDLGCGNVKGWGCPYEGEIIGVDIDAKSKADVTHNLEKFPYPFKDNEFDAVYSHHCLEHLEDTSRVMEEIARITKPNGKVFLVVPFGASARALNNPTHKKFFSIDVIRYYTEIEPTNETRFDFPKPKFKLLKARYNYIFRGVPEFQHWKGRLLRKLVNPPMGLIINLNTRIYEKILRYYVGDADEIEWELSVIKEE